MVLSSPQLRSSIAQGSLLVSPVGSRYSFWDGAQEEYWVIPLKKKRTPNNSLCLLIPKNLFFEEKGSGGGRHRLDRYKEMVTCGLWVTSKCPQHISANVRQPARARSRRPTHRTTLPKGPSWQKDILRDIPLLDTKRIMFFRSNCFLFHPRTIVPEGSPHYQLMLGTVGLRGHRI